MRMDYGLFKRETKKGTVYYMWYWKGNGRLTGAWRDAREYTSFLLAATTANSSAAAGGTTDPGSNGARQNRHPGAEPQTAQLPPLSEYPPVFSVRFLAMCVGSVPFALPGNGVHMLE